MFSGIGHGMLLCCERLSPLCGSELLSSRGLLDFAWDLFCTCIRIGLKMIDEFHKLTYNCKLDSIVTQLYKNMILT